MQIRPYLLPKTLEGSPPPSAECTLLSMAFTTLMAQPHQSVQSLTAGPLESHCPLPSLIVLIPVPRLEPAAHPTGSRLMPTHPSTLRPGPLLLEAFAASLPPLLLLRCPLPGLLPGPCASVPLNCQILSWTL